MKKTAKKTTKGREAPEVAPSFGPVVAAFANDQHITRKRMFSSDNVLSVKGKIFAMLVSGGNGEYRRARQPNLPDMSRTGAPSAEVTLGRKRGKAEWRAR